MFMRGGYGKDRDPPFLMLGYVTQTRIPIEMILRGALLCLRGSRTPRRRQFANIRNNDLELGNGLAGLN